MDQTKTNVFISYSFNSSKDIKKDMANKLEAASYAVNYSEKEDISEKSDEEIWKYLRPRIAGSSVMIVIYSKDFENGKGGKAYPIRDSEFFNSHKSDFQRQGWVYKEIKCALREEKNNAMNGIIVVMPDEIYNQMFSKGICSRTLKESLYLNKELYPPILQENFANKRNGLWTPNCGCCLSILDDSYIPIVKLSIFYSEMDYYIKLVKEKRNNAEQYEITKRF